LNDRFTADIILDLPWSNYCQAENDKLYFDTSLLTSPITINITFGPYTSIWGQTYVPPSTQFSAKVFYRQIELTNRNQSLRNTLYSQPESVISYPSVYRQVFPTNFVVPASEDTPIMINLMSFLGADLLSMTFSAHLDTDLNTSSGTAGAPVNPWSCLDIYDVSLMFGGDVIYNAPGYSWRLIQQESNVSSVYLTNTYANQSGGTGPNVAGAKFSHVLQIDMSRLRQMCNSYKFFNTIRLPKQVLQLAFKLKPGIYWTAGNATPYSKTLAPGAACTLFSTYYYPQVTEVNSTGSVNIFYN
jgi:hypothetical protein